MLYFKNTELTKSYHVALNTVLNWIKSAELGKLEIELISKDGRSYIANTAKNTAVLEEMVNARRKFRNGRTYKEIKPKPEFYGTFKKSQILDIVTNLDVHHELDRQYGYFGEGATAWNTYADKLLDEDEPNLMNRSIQLLELSQPIINELICSRKRVNIIDIGPGNALPVRDLIRFLKDRKLLGRYVGLDISADMLDIAKVNIKKWFNDEVEFEGYQLDISQTRFADILSSEYFMSTKSNAINIILMLGSTINNFRSPDSALKNIQSSMGKDDLVIHTLKLDTENSRKFFNLGSEKLSLSIPSTNRYVLDLLGLDESMYVAEMGFDAKTKQRYMRAKLNLSLQIVFEFENGIRTVELNKGQSILVWRFWHQSATDFTDLLMRNELYPLQSLQMRDKEYLLTISCLNPDSFLGVNAHNIS